MYAGNERSMTAKHIEHRLAHPRHDAHADDYVRTVGQFYPNVRNWAPKRTHRKRHYIQRAPPHATVEKSMKRPPHFIGRDPIVRWTSVVLARAADERSVLDARHVRRIGPGEIAAWSFFPVELPQRTPR